LTKNNNRFYYKPSKFIRRGLVKMLLGVHEINEQIDTALVQPHWTSYLSRRTYRNTDEPQMQ